MTSHDQTGTADTAAATADGAAAVPTHYFDSGVSLSVLRHHLARAREVVRIATGFFTVRGYSLLRGAVRDKRVRLLVGIEEPGEERARKLLLQEILRDLRTGVDRDRRRSALELVAKMEAGDLRIIDARARAHHAKLYIADAAVALVASANVSGRGLSEAIEAGAVLQDPAQVADFVRWFDEHFHARDCVDITGDLLAALRAWLRLVRPWDVYLKTVLALKALEETNLQRASYRKPTGFQREVVANALRQIEEYRGALVVASTGLGKTVIGTDVALRLHEARRLRNVLVIGPKATRKAWEEHLQPAGLSLRYFVHQALDAADARHNADVADLESILETLDEEWLILVDECHEMRNRFVGPGRRARERRVFQRLVAAVRRAHCAVLLLTGTPFSTTVENVNNQLFLLPHTGPDRTLFAAEYPEGRAWRVEELAHLRTLPVCSVITTPYVARAYGTRDEWGTHIDLGGTPHYIPRVRLYQTEFSLPVEQAVTAALEGGLFRVTHAGKTKWLQANIENLVRVAWASSPRALRHVLHRVLATADAPEAAPGSSSSSRGGDTPTQTEDGSGGYRVLFTHRLSEREARLRPVILRLDALPPGEDQKLQALCRELDRLRAGGDLAVVFAEQLATVDYLRESLETLRPGLRVASTVVRNASGGYHQKSARAISRLLGAFAPVAQRRSGSSNSAGEYDVFLTTDAFGVGVNMQDARAVFNYDLAWTPIEPAQRAGRILRFWPEPRTVELHTFCPRLTMPDGGDAPMRRRTDGVRRRWERLADRHGLANQVLDLPTLAVEAAVRDFHPGDLAVPGSSSSSPDAVPTAATAAAHAALLGELDLAKLDENAGVLDVSPVFRHTSILERHRARAAALPDDLRSARLYPGSDPLVFVLLRHNGRYHWPVWDVHRRRLRRRFQEGELLNLIQCDESEEAAPVGDDVIEAAADDCVRAWSRAASADPNSVVRICTLYLAPRNAAPTRTPPGGSLLPLLLADG